MYVGVEWLAGSKGSPGRREGECRPGCETKAGSQTHVEEGSARGGRCGPLHADPRHAFEDPLEAHKEPRTGESLLRGGDTTPRTPMISRPRNVTSASQCNLQALQTPMPESQPGSVLGPPPPYTTPAPLRKSSSAIIVFHSPYFEVSEARIVFKLVSMLCEAARIEITITDNITCICK